MPFCPNCGKEIGSDVKFCPSCGFNLKGEEKSSTPTKTTKTTEMNLDARTYLIISIAGLGGLSLLSIILRDSLGFILCAALAAALYFWGFKKLEANDIPTAKITSLIVGIVTGVVGLAILLAGRFLGFVDILVVIPALLAWHKLEKG